MICSGVSICGGLEAEEIRDSMLAVCGNLNLEDGRAERLSEDFRRKCLAGQSRPGDGWGESTPEEQARRSVYVHVKRSLRCRCWRRSTSADTDASCPARFATTQPTQALAMLNGEFLNEQASNLGRRRAQGKPATMSRPSAPGAAARVTEREPTDDRNRIAAWNSSNSLQHAARP